MRWMPPCLAIALLLVACGGEDSFDLHYSVELGGTALGWAGTSVPDSTTLASGATTTRSRTVLVLEFLGQDFDQVTTEHVTLGRDGTVRGVLRRIEAGATHVESRWWIDGDSLRFLLPAGGGERALPVPDDLDGNTPFDFGPAVAALVEGPDSTVAVSTPDATHGRTIVQRFRRVGVDTLAVPGGRHVCLRMVASIPALSAEANVWADVEDGMLVRLESADGMVVLRTDASIIDRVRRGSIDDLLLAPVDTVIGDPRRIARMRVRASLHAIGPPLVPGDLDVGGQRFDGTVVGDRVDGVFEIDRIVHDGASSPRLGAPVDDPSLGRYLRPETFIESDDPILAAKARALTADADTRWDAVVAISSWVDREIGYAIPGGGTARATFDQRAGECGGHSRLTIAMLRALGVPSRMVVGCMLFDRDGRANFGQHGWVEVHMGPEAGWVAVDPTIGEIGDVDAGHVRLGEFASFRPIDMQIEEIVLDEPTTP